MRSTQRVLLVSWILAMGVGCDGTRGGADASFEDAGGAADGGGTDAGVADAGSVDASTSDAGPVPDGGSASCTPTAGSEVLDAACQQVAISVLRHGTENPTAEVHALLTSVDTRCVEVQSIVLLDDDTEVQSFDGVGTRRASGGSVMVTATAPMADPGLVSHCESGEGRFDRYRVRIRGQVDGGSFEAECGRPSSGASWPPDSVVLCHQGLEHGPFFAGSAEVRTFMTSTSSSADVHYPHLGGEPAITTLGGSVDIFGEPDPFLSTGPLDPVSTIGWTGLINVSAFSAPRLDVSLNALGDAFEALCPESAGGIDDPQPVTIVRFRGTGPGGAFESEGHVGTCYRSTSSP
ncbi:MAG: hypothetical protein AB8I08_26935 [Sandaracinaceae bacterium]